MNKYDITITYQLLTHDNLLTHAFERRKLQKRGKKIKGTRKELKKRSTREEYELNIKEMIKINGMQNVSNSEVSQKPQQIKVPITNTGKQTTSTEIYNENLKIFKTLYQMLHS